jgi:chromatin remodeling complex protein RSC6
MGHRITPNEIEQIKKETEHKGIKDSGSIPFANVPMNEKIARGLGMMADGLIEAGKYKFADFIESVVELVGIQNTRSYAKYLEAGWNKKAESDCRLERAGSVDACLSAQSNQTMKKTGESKEMETLVPINPAEEHKTSLTPNALMILGMWRRGRPNLVKCLEKDGSLEAVLLATSEEILRAEKTMTEQGLDKMRIREEIETEYLYLPDYH